MRTKASEHQLAMINQLIVTLQEINPLEGGSFYDVTPELYLKDGGWTFVQCWPSGGYRVIFHGTLSQVRSKLAEMIVEAKEHRYKEACRMALEWLDNLVFKYGEAQVIDCLPNNFGGRVLLQEVINLE